MSHIDELDRLIDDDPVRNHERIMGMLKPTLSVIYKDFHGRQPSPGDDNGNGNQVPMSSDEQIDALIDAVSQALAQTRNELRDEFASIVESAVGPLAEQVAVMQSQVNVMQGQVSVLMNMIGNSTGITNTGTRSIVRSVEATETVRKRRVRVRSDDK
jgi:hypothetical protein